MKLLWFNFKGKIDNTDFSVNGITTLQSDVNADLYTYIGLAHLSLKNLDSTTFYIRQAIERNPSEADFYVNVELIQEHRMDTLSAIKEYQKALSYQPDHAAALSNLSKLSTERMYDPLIFQCYDFAVEDQGSYQSFFNRGVMLQSRGKHTLAIEDFTKALELAGSDGEIFLMRAFSKKASENLEGGIEDYNQALNMNYSTAKAPIEAYCTPTSFEEESEH